MVHTQAFPLVQVDDSLEAKIDVTSVDEDESTVTVDGSDSVAEHSDVVSYDWDLGDGATATGETVTHTYDAAGQYDITLQLSNDQRLSDRATVTVTVGNIDETVTVAPGGSLAFEPALLTVEPGTTVSFVWDADGHTLAVDSRPEGDDGSGAPEEHDAGFEHVHTFEMLGDYAYFCEIHPEEMQGTVTVEDGVDCQPIPAAVAGEDGRIDDFELLVAIEYWRTSTEVPETCG